MYSKVKDIKAQLGDDQEDDDHFRYVDLSIYAMMMIVTSRHLKKKMMMTYHSLCQMLKMNCLLGPL